MPHLTFQSLTGLQPNFALLVANFDHNMRHLYMGLLIPSSLATVPFQLVVQSCVTAEKTTVLKFTIN
jgi:hypothetical protein